MLFAFSIKEKKMKKINIAVKSIGLCCSIILFYGVGKNFHVEEKISVPVRKVMDNERGCVYSYSYTREDASQTEMSTCPKII